MLPAPCLLPHHDRFGRHSAEIASDGNHDLADGEEAPPSFQMVHRSSLRARATLCSTIDVGLIVAHVKAESEIETIG